MVVKIRHNVNVLAVLAQKLDPCADLVGISVENIIHITLRQPVGVKEPVLIVELYKRKFCASETAECKRLIARQIALDQSVCLLVRGRALSEKRCGKVIVAVGKFGARSVVQMLEIIKNI